MRQGNRQVRGRPPGSSRPQHLTGSRRRSYIPATLLHSRITFFLIQFYYISSFPLLICANHGFRAQLCGSEDGIPLFWAAPGRRTTVLEPNCVVQKPNSALPPVSPLRTTILPFKNVVRKTNSVVLGCFRLVNHGFESCFGGSRTGFLTSE